jgi:hypothetical protein
MLWRFGRILLVVVYASLAASLLLFSLFEAFPSLLDAVNLQATLLLDSRVVELRIV